MSTAGKIMVNPDLGRKEWKSIGPIEFWKKLMKTRIELHIIKDPNFCFLWFESGPAYCTKITYESWLCDILMRNFPDKMTAASGYDDSSRWQTISKKEIKALAKK